MEAPMKPLASILLVLPFALFLGCDPGMTVRQINSTVDSKKTSVVVPPEMTIEIKTTHQLIGEGWYDPQVKVKNSSDSPITITRVELVAQAATYENQPRAAESYPLTLPARSTASLDIGFRFNQGVNRVFKKPAELRIHYLTGGHDGLTRITVAAGPLNAR
jgi:hypothetical protein